MLDSILEYLLRYNFPINVKGRKNAEAFIHWGELYTTYNESDYDNLEAFQSYPDVIIHFPITPVKVFSYYLQYVQNDIFPTKWTLYGSQLENKEWEPISTVEQSLCNDTYKPEEDHQKIYCKQSEIKKFSIPYPNDIYYYYLKFSLQQNSYNQDDHWQYVIKTTGFEISGDILMPFNQLTHNTKQFLQLSTLFIISLNNK